ncbi:MAG TPA: mechanosensitive ion channel domain-containing protein, partial [Chitinophagaceae bacterium]|nr:mechanosensitive ion channel domain-containing protein [Chitinophagaceae bacterium]
MKSILHEVILDNTVLSYIICFGTILLVFLIKRYLSHFIAWTSFRILQRTSWKIDEKEFTGLMVGPLGNFLLAFITVAALDKLNYPRDLSFDIIHVPSTRILASIGRGVIIVFFTWLLLRSIDFVALLLERKADMTPGTTHNQLIVFFKDFFKVIIGIVGVLLLIQFSFHKDISAGLGGVGIATAAVALAAKESIENLIASFIIFFDKPFHIGDLVKVNAVTGTIEKIGLRSTRIRTDQKTYVTVPNKQMVDSVTDNLTLRTQRRVDLDLTISLGTSATQLQQLIDGIKAIVQQAPIENRVVLLNDISPTAFLVHAEYYT